MELAGFDTSLLYSMGPFEFYGQMNFMKAVSRWPTSSRR